MGRLFGKLLLTAFGLAFLVFRLAIPHHYGRTIVGRSQEFNESTTISRVFALPPARNQRTFREEVKISPEFRILIAVMSPYWASWRRQIVRNAYKKFSQSLPVDVIFVEGVLSGPFNNSDRVRAMQRTVIDWENSTYGDILHLDCEENMNNGKTYEFLKKVGRELGHKYTHLMKTDDDAFINIPGISTSMPLIDCSSRSSYFRTTP